MLASAAIEAAKPCECVPIGWQMPASEHKRPSVSMTRLRLAAVPSLPGTLAMTGSLHGIVVGVSGDSQRADMLAALMGDFEPLRRSLPGIGRTRILSRQAAEA